MNLSSSLKSDSDTPVLATLGGLVRDDTARAHTWKPTSVGSPGVRQVSVRHVLLDAKGPEEVLARMAPRSLAGTRWFARSIPQGVIRFRWLVVAVLAS